MALSLSAQVAWSAQCKPHHFRAPYFIKTMGRCAFDQTTLSFHGDGVEQARCLMRGMDETRNLGAQMAMMPAPLADRVGNEAGLPTREVLSTYLSKLDLEWDFAQYLWLPISRANDNDPTAPMARYFVIHDTSGPNFGHRAFPEEVDNGNSKINSLNKFRCSDGWGKAHVVINRSGDMLLNHELEIPWRETKFEQAANFSGALKGLFLHVELIQPRRAASSRSRHNDAQKPQSGFHARAIRPACAPLRDRERPLAALAHSGLPRRARRRYSQRPRRSVEFRSGKLCREHDAKWNLYPVDPSDPHHDAPGERSRQRSGRRTRTRCRARR
jgi:hypothetical protein